MLGMYNLGACSTFFADPSGDACGGTGVASFFADYLTMQSATCAFYLVTRSAAEASH